MGAGARRAVPATEGALLALLAVAAVSPTRVRVPVATQAHRGRLGRAQTACSFDIEER